MMSSAPPRPLVAAALLAGVAVVLAGCGVNERDPHRFETLADSVAAIPVSTEAGRSAARTEPLKVELLTPHELWDARDGVAGRVRVAVAAPDEARETAPTTPVEPIAPTASRLIQLGAFASEAGARAAWERMRRGEGATALDGLHPAFEGVEVGGRRLVRLNVAASSDRVEALCRVLAAADPWCARSQSAPSTGAA